MSVRRELSYLFYLTIIAERFFFSILSKQFSALFGRLPALLCARFRIASAHILFFENF